MPINKPFPTVPRFQSRFLLSFMEDFGSVSVIAGYIIEACFYQLDGLFRVVGQSDMAFFAAFLEIDPSRWGADKGVSDFSLFEQFLNVKDVFGLVVVHGCFEVPTCAQRYAQDSLNIRLRLRT